MSVQVSYKKQILLGFFLLLLLLCIFEITLRIYDYYNPNCGFMKSQVYDTIDYDKKRIICLDHKNFKWTNNPTLEIFPNQHYNTININEYGFRGKSISIEKPVDVFRIFIVGGSTVFGVGSSSDNSTISGYLQELYDDSNTDFKVEVINAGIPNAYSSDELYIINNKLLKFNPDLIIVYDGWNDIYRNVELSKLIDHEFFTQLSEAFLKNDYYKTGTILLHNYHTWQKNQLYVANKTMAFNEKEIDAKVLLWKNNMNEICNLKSAKTDMLSVLQPIVGTGHKILTEEEEKHFIAYDHNKVIPHYEKFATEINQLNNVCDGITDGRDFFDTQSSTIYFDSGHVGDKGNSIIAEKLYQISLPLIERHYSKSYP